MIPSLLTTDTEYDADYMMKCYTSVKRELAENSSEVS